MIKKAEYPSSVSSYVADKLMAIMPDGKKIVVEINPELGVQNAWRAAEKEIACLQKKK